MSHRFWFSALAGVAACASASARSVSLETFDQSTKPDFVLSARPVQHSAPNAAAAGFTANSSDALAYDFSVIGAARASVGRMPASSAVRPTHMSVPAWMAPRGGQGARSRFRYFRAPAPAFVSSSYSLAFRAEESPSGCSRAVYRPNGLRAEVEVRRSHYYALMVEIACETGVPVNLFDALLTQESGYNPYALSPKGAVGIAQLMPATAKTAGVTKPWDIEDNMRGGARVLKTHLAEFGRYDLALAAYNAGAGRVRGTGRVPRIHETAAYVNSILADVSRQFAADLDYCAKGAGCATSSASMASSQERQTD
jgi:soluble lytic murein transglycosylase-like protein